MSGKLLITISVIFSCSGILRSSDADSLIVFADEQMMKGNYEMATKELLRVNFFMDNEDPDVLIRLADCYYSLGDWETARLYYDQVYRIAENENLITRARLSKISSLVLEKSYKPALLNLYAISDSLYNLHHVDIDVLFAICYFGLEDFDKSKEYFKRAAGNNEPAKARIDSIFSLKKYFNRPSPALAFILSGIVPGLGQIYSGDVSDGLNSFLLTQAFFVLGLTIAFEYSIIDALVSAVPWYQRYYMGGLGNSTETAQLKRQKRRSIAFKMALDTLKEADQ